MQRRRTPRLLVIAKDPMNENDHNSDVFTVVSFEVRTLVYWDSNSFYHLSYPTIWPFTPFGRDARGWLSPWSPGAGRGKRILAGRRTVTIDTEATDRYVRIASDMWVDDENVSACTIGNGYDD